MRPERQLRNFLPLADLLAGHATRLGNKPAVIEVEGGHSISHLELVEGSARCAAWLRDQGVQRGMRVLLPGGNTIARLLAWLALWRLGATVCPVDLAFLGQQAQATLAAIGAQLQVVVSDASQPGEADVPSLRLPDWRSLPEVSEGALPASPGPDEVALMSCTSGTTGFPKIVVYDHYALWANGWDTVDALELSSAHRLLEYRTLGWYSAQILSLMPTLLTGLTLCLAPSFSRRRFPEWVQQHQVSVAVGVPAVIAILLDDPVHEAEEKLASLRFMTCSTAPLPNAHWTRFEALYHIPLRNLYGSSETGWIAASTAAATRKGSVGRVLPSIHLSLVSDCPGSAGGRIRIETPKLALGYLQPDGCLQPLRGHPFDMPDQAVIDEEGYLRLLGRTDRLINHGGVKVSPVEIEDMLITHPAVREAAVTAQPDAIRGEVPVCLVVLREGERLTAKDLLDWCRDCLPREKTPVEFSFVERLPYSARGKLLRDKLIDLHRPPH